MAEADLKIADAKPDDFHALVLPGDQINPDLLRINPDAMKVVKIFLDPGKPVAAICHAPWLLVQADAVRGLTLTSYKSIRKDVENAGGKRVDKEVAVDKGISPSVHPMTSRLSCQRSSKKCGKDASSIARRLDLQPGAGPTASDLGGLGACELAFLPLNYQGARE